MKRGWHRLRGMLAVAIVAIASWLLWQRLQGLSLEQLQESWAATPGSAIGWSLLATVGSFACLAVYEWYAIQRVAPGRVPRATALRVGLLSHAIANTLGLHAVTATAVRYQQYQCNGLGLAEVARIVAWVAACVAAGVVLVAASALAWLQWQALATPLAVTLLLLLVPVTGYVLVRTFRRSRTDGPAAGGFAAKLAAIATIEMICAVAALYVLLPAAQLPAPASVALLVIGATLLGIASHAPGGVGVFEATVLAGMPAASSEGTLLALLLYRGIYNLLPFLIAVLALAASRKRGFGTGLLSWKAGTAALADAGESTAAPICQCQLARDPAGDSHR